MRLLLIALLLVPCYSQAVNLTCTVQHIVDASWVGNTDNIAVVKDLKEDAYITKFIIGETAKSGYFDDDKSEWVWQQLIKTITPQGDIFHGPMKEGGYLTVLFDKGMHTALFNMSISNGETVTGEDIQTIVELATCTKDNK